MAGDRCYLPYAEQIVAARKEAETDAERDALDEASAHLLLSSHAFVDGIAALVEALTMIETRKSSQKLETGSVAPTIDPGEASKESSSEVRDDAAPDLVAQQSTFKGARFSDTFAAFMDYLFSLKVDGNRVPVPRECLNFKGRRNTDYNQFSRSDDGKWGPRNYGSNYSYDFGFCYANVSALPQKQTTVRQLCPHGAGCDWRHGPPTLVELAWIVEVAGYHQAEVFVKIWAKSWHNRESLGQKALPTTCDQNPRQCVGLVSQKGSARTTQQRSQLPKKVCTAFDWSCWKTYAGLFEKWEQWWADCSLAV